MRFEPICIGCYFRTAVAARCRFSKAWSGGVEKFQGVGGLGFGHLDAKHACRRIGAETTKPGGVFVGNKGMKVCSLEPGADKLRVR